MNIGIVGYRDYINYKDFKSRLEPLLAQYQVNVIIAFISTKSKGTWDVVNKCKKIGKTCHIVKID